MWWICSLLVVLIAVEEVSFRAAGVVRDDFPQDFVFGAGTSAYQVEGAAAEDGRSPSIWDTFTHAGKMPDKSTGDVASDGYHKYKEDVKSMSDTALDAYSFSISWSRLIPNGRGEINQKGLQYYNNLINDLLKHGIQPCVTLSHLDHPQILEDEYGGWVSRKIVGDFTAYADACFKEFGDRVLHWTTMTEPNVMSPASYGNGLWPPCRCSYPFGVACKEGNSTTEPYTALHNVLLAHASVVRLYREKYRDTQKGRIGLNIYAFWISPLTNSTVDIEAQQRAADFYFGWILDPLVFGDYPKIMKDIVDSRLPAFSESESEQVKGSFDFISLNYYLTFYVMDNPNNRKSGPRDFFADLSCLFAASKNDTPTSAPVPAHFEPQPSGLQKFLKYITHAYGNIPIYIQENGFGIAAGAKDAINDVERIDYLDGFIESTLYSIRNGSDVRGYFVWSFMDVFEFLSGYRSRYGLFHVDFEDEERTRTPKLSAHWYANLLKNRSLHINNEGSSFSMKSAS